MLTDLAVVPREKAHTGAAAREQPETPPTSRDEGLRLLHVLSPLLLSRGLWTNYFASLTLHFLISAQACHEAACTLSRF